MPDLPVDPRLDVLPAPSERRLAVRVTPDALRHVRASHPWVFADSITSITDGGRAGDLAVVFDQRRAFAAIGLFDPASPIRVKLLHHGAPATIDESWWRAAIARALDRRAPFVLAADAPELGYRVVNGENDGLPGLIVDRYADVLVVKVYSAAWFPHLAAVVRALVEVAGEAVPTTGVVLRLARTVARGETFGLADGDVIAGRLVTDIVVFREGGLAFEADVRHGQKTGWFLDQRANRMLVGAMADGLDVLDMFAATGGFSVHAAAGGARSVLSVDLSAPTLAAAARNMERNRTLPAVQACAHEIRVGDAFEVLSDLDRQEQALRIGGRRSAVVRPAPVERGGGAAGLLAPDPPRRSARGSRWSARAGFVLEPGPRERLLRDGRERRSRGRSSAAGDHPHGPRHRPPGHVSGGRLSEGWFLASPVTCFGHDCDRRQRDHHRVRITRVTASRCSS